MFRIGSHEEAMSELRSRDGSAGQHRFWALRGKSAFSSFFEEFMLEIVLLIVFIPGTYSFHALAGTLGAVVFLVLLAEIYAFVTWGQESEEEELRTFGCAIVKKVHYGQGCYFRWGRV